MSPLDLSPYRAYFPSLSQEINGQQVVYFDNPGGTQVALQVIDAVTDYYRTANANTGGAFLTSRRTDEVIANARRAMADFLHAGSPDEIVFGPNMTTLTFAFSRAIGKTLQAGDEIVVTVLDHDANVAPWLALQERGVVIRTVDVHPENVTLDMEDMRSKINERTKLVAVGYASNAAGTINDVAPLLAGRMKLGRWSGSMPCSSRRTGQSTCSNWMPIFLSAPRINSLGRTWAFYTARPNTWRAFPLIKCARPATWPRIAGKQARRTTRGWPGWSASSTTWRWSGASSPPTITSAFRDASGASLYSGRQRDLKVAMQAMMEYERGLSAYLLAGLREIRGIHIYGITNPAQLAQRVPTVICTIDGYTPRELAELLASHAIFAWDGNYYALGIMERMGLEERGGALRLGMAHYNTTAEIDRVLACLEQLG